MLPSPNGLEKDHSFRGCAAPFLAATAGTATNLDADELDGNNSTAFLQANAGAGGDLSGTYPNPQLAGDAVGASEVANGSLDIADVTSFTLNKSIDPPAIAAISCSDIKEHMNQGQADSGDFLVVNPPPTLPSGLVVFPMQTSFDAAAGLPALNFRVCNITANSIDAGSEVWKFAVFDDGNNS